MVTLGSPLGVSFGFIGGQLFTIISEVALDMAPQANDVFGVVQLPWFTIVCLS